MSIGNEPPVLAVVTDIIFSSRIRAEARALGQSVQLVNKLDSLSAALAASPRPKLLLVDLNCQLPDPLEMIKAAAVMSPDCRIIGFYSHVQADLAKNAADAGAGKVLPRSRFVQQLPEILRFADRDAPGNS